MAGLIDFFVPPGLQPFLAPDGVPTLPPSPALAGFGGASNPPINLAFGDQSADHPVTGLLADYRRVGLPSPAAQGSAWPEPNSSPPDALRQWAEAQVVRRIHGDPLRSADDRAAFDNADTTSSPNAYDPFEAAAARVRNAVSPAGGREEGRMTRLAERLVPSILRSWATLPQRAFEASERMRLTGEYDPAIFQATSLVAGGPAFAWGRVAPRPTPKPLERKGAGLYDPPRRPATPFEFDYPPEKWPNGPPADAAGRLTRDMEGRRLAAQYVVGRRTAGGSDVAFPPEQLNALTKAITGRRVTRFSADDHPGALGVTYMERMDPGGGRVGVRKDLAKADALKVQAHEIGHAIDMSGREIGNRYLEGELRDVYNTLNNPNRTPDGRKPAFWAKQFGPESRGYKDTQVRNELIAEAIRAYLTDPNYLKWVAPETAAEIRAVVNANPRLRRIIQFNTIGGGVPGFVPRSDEEE